MSNSNPSKATATTITKQRIVGLALLVAFSFGAYVVYCRYGWTYIPHWAVMFLASLIGPTAADQIDRRLGPVFEKIFKKESAERKKAVE